MYLRMICYSTMQIFSLYLFSFNIYFPKHNDNKKEILGKACYWKIAWKRKLHSYFRKWKRQTFKFSFLYVKKSLALMMSIWIQKFYSGIKYNRKTHNERHFYIFFLLTSIYVSNEIFLCKNIFAYICWALRNKYGINILELAKEW